MAHPCLNAGSRIILGFPAYVVGNALEDITQGYLHNGGNITFGDYRTELDVWVPGLISDDKIGYSIKHAMLPRDAMVAAREAAKDFLPKPTFRERIVGLFRSNVNAMDTTTQAEFLAKVSQAAKEELRRQGVL